MINNITSTSYNNPSHIFEDDPDTTSAWTQSGIDGCEFGIEIET